MSRTHKKKPYKFYQKEKKYFRKIHYKMYRGKCKKAIDSEDFDMVPEFKRTSGWMTW